MAAGGKNKEGNRVNGERKGQRRKPTTSSKGLGKRGLAWVGGHLNLKGKDRELSKVARDMRRDGEGESLLSGVNGNKRHILRKPTAG